MATTKAKKTTTRKKTSSRSGTGKKAKGVRTDVYFLVALGLMVLLCLSNFGLVGAVGRGVKWFEFGIMGVMGYAFPFVLAFNLLYRASYNEMPGRARIKFTATYCLMALIAAFIQRLTPSPEIKTASVGDFFIKSATDKIGGGFVGGLIVKCLSPTAIAGTIIILIILILICIVIISEWKVKNSVSAVRDKSRQAAGSIKRDYQDYSRHADETNERRMQIRREKAKAAEAMATELDEQDDDLRQYSRRQEDSQRRLRDRARLDADREKDLARADEELANLEELEKKYAGMKVPKFTEGEIKRAENKISGLGDFSISGFADDIDNLPDEDLSFDDMQDDTTEAFGEDTASRINGGFKEEKRFNSIIEKMAKMGESSKPMTKREPLPVDEPEEAAMHKEAQRPAPVKEKTVNEPRPHITTTKPPATPIKAEIAGKPEVMDGYEYPPVSLLKNNGGSSGNLMSENKRTALTLQNTLDTFGVDAKVTDISCGPAVTRFELQPGPRVKVSKIIGLSDEIKLNLAVPDIRIEAPIPGKAAIGIEIPNKQARSVSLRELIDSESFRSQKSLISFAVGEDIAGKPIMADIAKMPHLLIAGSTGSGKSVCINSLIMSVLYRARPDEVKMIMIDPKRVELSVYDGIPHLLIPVVTDPKKASGALNWAVAEMDARYTKFAEMKARNLADFNEKVKGSGNPELTTMPQMLVIIDELADLMMVASKEVETAICRLAQLARAAGIHLVIATQRPSVNVITGLIKNNVPSRIAFAVSSGVDSRTIIDMNGAEKLLGKGDMLFFPAGMPKPQRVQGAFVSDEEVAGVVNFLKEKNKKEPTPEETKEMEKVTSTLGTFPGGSAYEEEQRDELFEEAARFVIEKEKGSIGMLQRNFRIGFNRAGRIMDQLAEEGVVGPETGTKPRQILMTAEELEEYLKNNS